MEKWENDDQFRELRITKVEDDEDSYTITNEDGWCISVYKKHHIEPKVGMMARYYGKGIGRPVRGLMIGGRMVFYNTPQEQDEKQKQWCIDYENEQKQEFEKNKARLDAEYAALPDIFKRRIDKFRKNNPDFRWKYESYEMFICNEAVKIAKAFETTDTINSWKKLPYKEQIKSVPIAEGHSRNTFGMACYLACLYIEYPEGVEKLYGALAPLVGSEEYGCIPKKQTIRRNHKKGWRKERVKCDWKR